MYKWKDNWKKISLAPGVSRGSNMASYWSRHFCWSGLSPVCGLGFPPAALASDSWIAMFRASSSVRFPCRWLIWGTWRVPEWAAVPVAWWGMERFTLLIVLVTLLRIASKALLVLRVKELNIWLDRWEADEEFELVVLGWQLWSDGCRCVRQWFKPQASHMRGINSLFLHMAKEHRFLKTFSPWDWQFWSICALTTLSADSPAFIGTGLLHNGHMGTWWSPSSWWGHLCALKLKWLLQKILLHAEHLIGKKSVANKTCGWEKE